MEDKKNKIVIISNVVNSTENYFRTNVFFLTEKEFILFNICKKFEKKSKKNKSILMKINLGAR